MAKPKAEPWLTTAFANGVVELAAEARKRPVPAYEGAVGRCWLAQFDEHRRPCSGRFERFHFLRRQTVENAVAWQLRDATYYEPGGTADFVVRPGEPTVAIWDELALIAAWDPRNGEVGCEGHHRPFDHHATPSLIVPTPALPARTVDFVLDYGLETQAEDSFPGFASRLVEA